MSVPSVVAQGRVPLLRKGTTVCGRSRSPGEQLEGAGAPMPSLRRRSYPRSVWLTAGSAVVVVPGRHLHYGDVRSSWLMREDRRRSSSSLEANITEVLRPALSPSTSQRRAGEGGGTILCQGLAKTSKVRRLVASPQVLAWRSVYYLYCDLCDR